MLSGYCEEAVDIDSDPNYRDSRGLNRALLRDIRGALEDFQAFVNEAEDKQLVAQRRKYIESLARVAGGSCHCDALDYFHDFLMDEMRMGNQQPVEGFLGRVVPEIAHPKP